MHTGLSPEWDRGFDEAFTDLVCRDDDFVRAEFAALTQRSWPTPHDQHRARGEAHPQRRTGTSG